MNTLEPDNSDVRVYDATFLVVFLANLTLMSAASLLYLYADFVKAAGGSELQLGWIVGVGMVGAIGFRLFQGIAIDRIGIRVIWLSSLLIFIVGAIWHTQLATIATWQVYAARLLVASGIAGSLGSWLTFASLRAPQHRIAEVIGVVGTSGFCGMALGPTIGDFLLQGKPADMQSIDGIFIAAAIMAAISFVCAFLATKAKVQVRSTGVHRPFEAFRNTKLGFLLIIGMTMGMAASIPSTFVRPFTKSLGLESISIYFWIYNLVAFSCRIIFRKASETLGLQLMTILGLTSMGASMILYLLVSSSWTLIIPAIAAGISHAFLFPAVMTAGASRFPSQYRGLAMSLMFAIFDFGLFVGAPIFGFLLWLAESNSWQAYPFAFTCFSIWVALVTGWYAYAKRFKNRPPHQERDS